ncbi:MULTISPECIES: hypothetical protein [unclassified Microbulbifer]|uniref:hypothetical protein n=1 Tax=unclassified Microbulbifer TaxID=2619833 RepID=UPI0027E3F217|nr:MULTISPECIES: hypothetical protein [unclassified Microbulbifer]
MDTFLRHIASYLLLVPLCLSTGCERTSREDAAAPQSAGSEELAWTPEILGEYPIELFDNYTETGDLDAIRKHE